MNNLWNDPAKEREGEEADAGGGGGRAMHACVRMLTRRRGRPSAIFEATGCVVYFYAR